MRAAYEMILRLYPAAFRGRYGAEMALDFADGWAEARGVGRAAMLAFAGRAALDVSMSLPREWTRGSHAGIAAVTVAVTLMLWGLALRPWAWHWETQPRIHAATSVTSD